MEPITKRVHSQKNTESKACPTCYQPIAQNCGCKSRGPIKYNNPIMKQSCKY